MAMSSSRNAANVVLNFFISRGFVIGSVLDFVFRKCRDCANTAYKIVNEDEE